MQVVTGIGGFFFRARDPTALALWYQERLGITPAPETYEGSPGNSKRGRRSSHRSRRTPR